MVLVTVLVVALKRGSAPGDGGGCCCCLHRLSGCSSDEAHIALFMLQSTGQKEGKKKWGKDFLPEFFFFFFEEKEIKEKSRAIFVT